MKASIKALPFVLIAGMTIPTAQAETTQTEDSKGPKKVIAVLSSGIVGGLIAGPVGFFVAGVGAGWLVENESISNAGPQSENGIKTPQPIELLIEPAVLVTQESANDSLGSAILLNLRSEDSQVLAESSNVILASTSIDTRQGDAALVLVEAETDAGMDALEATLLFGSSQYSLSESMNDQLLDLSKALKKLPNGLIQIDGHTDPRGDSEFNLDLSQRRADAVADFLIVQGIDPALIVVRSHGETRSSSGDYDYEDHIAERSVDISISSVLVSSIVSQDGFSSEVSMPVAQNKQ